MAQIKDLKRMCKSYNECNKCPLNSSCLPPSIVKDNVDEIVDNWVKEHPVKTYAQDFFEKFPNALKYNNRPAYCRANIYGEKLECYEGGCDECWNQEMKENA